MSSKISDFPSFLFQISIQCTGTDKSDTCYKNKDNGNKETPLCDIDGIYDPTRKTGACVGCKADKVMGGTGDGKTKGTCDAYDLFCCASGECKKSGECT